MCSSKAAWLGGLILAMVLCQTNAFAQAVSQSPDAQRIEVFGGYSYLPERDALVKSFNDSGHGWGVGVSRNLHKYVGLFADFDVHSWTTHLRTLCPPSGTCFTLPDVHNTVYAASAGPRFVVPVNRAVVFGLVSWEYHRNRSNTESTSMGLGFGGGVDLGLTRRLAVRVIQVNSSLPFLGEGPGRDLRLKTGLVFRF